MGAGLPAKRPAQPPNIYQAASKVCAVAALRYNRRLAVPGGCAFPAGRLTNLGFYWA
ncbi:protein of unknown function [Pseudomonas sp. JV551A1]|nr:protein of unknown function [Pseudomonas sp. JV551A1]